MIDPESDEDEDEDEDEDADGEDLDEDDVNGQLDQQLLGNEDSEEDADGEDDEDMDDHPTPPVIKQQRGTASVRSNITVAPPPSKALKSVEAKEMEDDDDDEELSELESNDDLGNDQDEDNDDEEEDSGSDEDDENSRSATPDLTKLTKRQRAAFEEDPSLMALSNEALKKKHLTDEEHVQRRAEMARRRKNLSEKRNEEEKVSTAACSPPKEGKANACARWKRSTSFFKSKHQNDVLGLRLQLPTPPSTRAKKTRKVDRSQTRCTSAGLATRTAVGWVCRRNGCMRQLVTSSDGRVVGD